MNKIFLIQIPIKAFKINGLQFYQKVFLVIPIINNDDLNGHY